MEELKQAKKNKRTRVTKWLFFLCLILPIVALGFFNVYRIYERLFEEVLALANVRDVEPREAVIINFAVPVLSEKYGQGIRTIPEQPVRVTFSDDKRKAFISPRDFWRPENEYRVILPEGRTAMLTKINSAELVFSTTNYPRVKEIFPANHSKDVVLGAEDPIVIDFDKSTLGFFVDFSLNPESEVVYQNNSEKTQFKILPKDKIEEGVSYSLDISIKVLDSGDENYQKIYASSFETLPPAPLNWEKDYQLRLAQARKYTRPSLTVGKYIDINLKTQIMTIFENGILLDAFLVSSGKRGMDTPIMETKIYNKAPRPYSKAYGLYMPYWMAILSDGKVGIHELPEWPGGYKEGENHLGTPVSHGCIRLGVGPAKTVYDWAEIGTPVVTH